MLAYSRRPNAGNNRMSQFSAPVRLSPIQIPERGRARKGRGSFPLLFSPFQLGGLLLPNRVVMAPMSSSLADLNGFVTPELIAFIQARAVGGTGLIVVEFTCVDARYGLGELRQPRLDSDDYIAGHAALVNSITSTGARACLQLHMPGQYIIPGTASKGMPVAPSDVYARNGKQSARAMTSEEVSQLVTRFADGARRAVAAGYEAIEIHGAHGYLPMAFMSPHKNQRNDAWGGDFDRRLAFPIAIIAAIKKEIGPSRPLIYRVSAAEFVESGLSITDMELIVPCLAQAGCDALHVSTGSVEGALDKIVDPMSSHEGWRFPLGRRLREASGLPVIAVGPVRWPETAERALKDGDADLIALGRPLLADPAWPRKAGAGRLEDITPCTNCNWCMERLREHAAIACAENPATGRELEDLSNMRPATGKVAVVIGAGPGGLHAALEFDLRGFDTHLFEARSEIGGGLLVSAAPPFKEPLYWYWHHLGHRLANSNVYVHIGVRATAADVLALNPDLVVVATGTRSRPWPLESEGGALPVHDATDVLNGDVAPDVLGTTCGLPVIVYGGGETGCETAEFLSARGMAVTLVTRSALNELARSAESIYRRQLRARLAGNPLIEVIPHGTITQLRDEGLVVQLASGESRVVAAASLVVAQGREPADELVDGLRVTGVACEVIGDAHAVGRIGDAVHAGHAAVRKLAAGLASKACAG